MEKFEYTITKYPSEKLHHLVYACSMAGECRPDHVPEEQMEVLTDILNERGDQGWELVQFIFGKDGMMAFWKRKIRES